MILEPKVGRYVDKNTLHDFDVSVVIASYQTPVHLLERAVNSGLQGNVEVVLVYDGDKPLFVPVHPKVKVIHQEKEGVAAAWNLGIEAAEGRYIMILGDDDFLEAGCLQKLVDRLDGHDGLAYAYGDVRTVGGVHVTPGWKRHEKGERLRTGYAVLWPAHLKETCRFYAPADLPVYLTDYDFILQLEREGCVGLKVPGVVLNNLEKPRMGKSIEQHRAGIEKHLWGRFK